MEHSSLKSALPRCCYVHAEFYRISELDKNGFISPVDGSIQLRFRVKK